MDRTFNFRDFQNTDNMDGIFLKELSGDHFKLTVCSNSFFLPVMFNGTVLLALDYCDWKSSKQTWKRARWCNSCQLLEPLFLYLPPSHEASENRRFGGN